LPKQSRSKLEITASFDKLHEIELGKILDNFKALQNLRVQIGGAIGTLSFALFGVGISSQKAGIFFFGSFILLIYTYLDAMIRTVMASHFYRVTQIKSRYTPDDKDAFLGFQMSISKSMVAQLEKLASLPAEKRDHVLRGIGYRNPTLASFWIPFTAAIIEIVFGILVWLTFQWPIF
jgi:hypothetical protein